MPAKHIWWWHFPERSHGERGAVEDPPRPAARRLSDGMALRCVGTRLAIAAASRLSLRSYRRTPCRTTNSRSRRCGPARQPRDGCPVISGGPVLRQRPTLLVIDADNAVHSRTPLRAVAETSRYCSDSALPSTRHQIPAPNGPPHRLPRHYAAPGAEIGDCHNCASQRAKLWDFGFGASSRGRHRPLRNLRPMSRRKDPHSRESGICLASSARVGLRPPRPTMERNRRGLPHQRPRRVGRRRQQGYGFRGGQDARRRGLPGRDRGPHQGRRRSCRHRDRAPRGHRDRRARRHHLARRRPARGGAGTRRAG